MILEEETFAKFGYYPKDWLPKSAKKILATCDDCGKVRVIEKKSYRSFCQSCAQKGDRSPRWNGGKIKRICPICGMEFSADLWAIKHSYGKFCSTSCSQLGENNNAWKGGKSFEPYCFKFNTKFKEYIRNKFERICFLCGKTETENGRKLDVHHVNFNKNCGCDSDETCQFVPLCISCNAKVNFHREAWERKIKNKLKIKLDGWYI